MLSAVDIALAIVGCASALPFGAVAGAWCFELYEHARARRALRDSLGLLVGEQEDPFASEGLPCQVLRFVLWLAPRKGNDPLASPRIRRVLLVGSSSFGELAWKAGLSESCTSDDLVRARGWLAIGCCAAGLLVGAVFTWQLALLLATVGLALGFAAIPWAFRKESEARSRQVEAELSQMLDVMVLGLRSGLTFQKALDLYCQHFETALGTAFMAAIRRWEWGLSDRDVALKALAASYDSPLLTRGVDSMIRSIRFGTSISDVLEDVSADARELHKSRVEEEVAKAPVKMMLPIGTLVLPAMLLIVLGPVLLELMQGF